MPHVTARGGPQRCAVLVPGLCLLASFCIPSARAQRTFEGYGAVTGGALHAPGGCETCYVTSLADTGPGTLRDAVDRYNGTGRYVVFDVAGTITLQTDIIIRGAYITIDGTTAPSPGITIRKANIWDGEFIIAGTHDVVITDLRFWGHWVAGGEHSQNACTISIDGNTAPDYAARRIVLDHLSLRGSTDGGPDIWGECSDITVSWCLIYLNWHPMIISEHPGLHLRDRISVHHNVLACNGERNPQIRGDVRNLDYVNNVVYDWGYFGENSGYGIRIKNVPGEPVVNANLVNNALLPTRRPDWALVYGTVPGGDDEDGGPANPVPQGTVVTTSLMGDLWVAGNVLPEKNEDHYSTIPQPLAVPDSARVATWPALELGVRVLPDVGMLYPDATELALRAELAEVFQQIGGGPPEPMPGDLNCDGGVNALDTNPFVLALTSPTLYAAQQPDCDLLLADCNDDGDVNALDINPFARLVAGP